MIDFHFGKAHRNCEGSSRRDFLRGGGLGLGSLSLANLLQRKAKAAEQGGADGVSCINTVLGMAVDWRKRKPILANIVGGLSGPAIKPIALRCVYQVARAVKIPVVGIGGISNIDDVMEFLVAGASAVQIGTANYYDPTISVRLIEQLQQTLCEIGASSVREIVGSLNIAQNK